MPPRPAEPYDVPDDAAGRVRYLEQPPAPRRFDLAGPSASASEPAFELAPAPTATNGVRREEEIAGWVAVAALALVLLVVFIIGMRLTS